MGQAVPRGPALGAPLWSSQTDKRAEAGAKRAECPGPCSRDAAVLGLEPKQLCRSLAAQFWGKPEFGSRCGAATALLLPRGFGPRAAFSPGWRQVCSGCLGLRLQLALALASLPDFPVSVQYGT